MPLLLSKRTPPAAAEAALTRLPPVPDGKPRGGSATGFKARKGVTAAGPLPVHRLGLPGVIDGSPKTSAAVSAWRFLLLSRGKVAEIADVVCHGRAGCRLGVVADGSAWNDLLEAAAALAPDDGPSYRLAVVTVPELRMEALWLRASRSAGDRFLPLPGQLQTDTPALAAAEFHALLRNAASRRNNRRPRRGGPTPR